MTIYYVDALHGDDANDGLTPATAVQTIAVAWALMTGGRADG